MLGLPFEVDGTVCRLLTTDPSDISVVINCKWEHYVMIKDKAKNSGGVLKVHSFIYIYYVLGKVRVSLLNYHDYVSFYTFLFLSSPSIFSEIWQLT